MIIEMAGRSYTIHHIQDGYELFQKLVRETPKFFTYDTETTGLHVIADKPFKGAVCFKNQVYLFDTTYDILRWFPKWCEQVKKVVMHNACFDLNMTANVIGEEEALRTNNFVDTQALVLLATESVSENRGGIKLALKYLATKYIDANANKYEIELKNYKRQLETQRQRMLTAYLKEVGWTKKRYQEAIKHKEELPEDVKEIVRLWEQDHPEPTYADIPEEILYPYLATDVILTQLLYEKCAPVVINRGQLDALKIENAIIPVTVRMGRVGLDVDHEYLKESEKKLEAEIRKKYEELWAITELKGFKFTANQHAKIKKYYQAKGIFLESADSDHLEDVGDREAELIVKLRTLEKWLSTYIRKIQKDTEYDGRFYSMLNPFKAVSGRFSGDSQQFPKFPLKDDDGNELFHPRRAFKGRWVFQDFSQVELRVAAHWTTFFGYDKNLCKAYMPYGCYHYKTKEQYNPTDYSMRHRWKEFREGHPKDKHWEDLLKEGWSVWVDPDTNEPWKPTDLHQATADKAVAFLTEKGRTDLVERFDKKQWRQLGKRANFLLLYQGTVRALQKALKIDQETAQALYDGFKAAFPGLVTYAEMVNKRMYQRGFCVNVYGRKYYMSDPSQFYCIANYLIQGTCAYDLKTKLIRIDEYLRSVGAKTKIVLCIHDEIIFTKVEGEEHHIKKIVEIMEDSRMLNVPLVSEGEVTDTYWSEKHKPA